MSAKEIDKTIKKLGNYFEYAEKRLAIHEAAHVVTTYLVGHSCLSMQTGLHRNVDLKNNNVEIDAQSISQIHNIFPEHLDKVLQLFTVGYNLQSASIKLGITQKIIYDEIKKHILVLTAGYVAEKHFYDTIWYWKLRQIPKKYSMDLTPSDLRHDLTKINFLSGHIAMNVQQQAKYKKIVRGILKNKIVKKTCFELANVCLKKTKISQNEIEDILQQSGFTQIRADLYNSILSKL